MASSSCSPASILTFTAYPHPRGPQLKCRLSWRRLLLPGLCPHRCPHPWCCLHPLPPRPSARVPVVVASSSVARLYPQSSSVARLPSAPARHLSTSAGCRGVLPGLYPHLCPHPWCCLYPHPPRPSARVPVVVASSSCSPASILTSILTAYPHPRGPQHECRLSWRRSVARPPSSPARPSARVPVVAASSSCFPASILTSVLIAVLTPGARRRGRRVVVASSSRRRRRVVVAASSSRRRRCVVVVIAPRFYPHRYPHPYPHRPGSHQPRRSSPRRRRVAPRNCQPDCQPCTRAASSPRGCSWLL